MAGLVSAIHVFDLLKLPRRPKENARKIHQLENEE
jgi:hypothetical protein